MTPESPHPKPPTPAPADPTTPTAPMAPTDPVSELAALTGLSARPGPASDCAPDSDSDPVTVPDSTSGTDAVARLRTRLAAAAERDGVLDIAYRTLPSPVGTLLLAATSEGLVRVAFPVQDHDAVLRDLAATLSPRLLRAPARLDAVSRQLEEYFAGRRPRFDLPLDFRLSRGFRRTVLGCLTEIAFGRTESYAGVATAAGSPRAVRAVGTACATNPLPVVVPCHRVVRSDGSAGGYAGGPEAKRTLLALESRAA